MGSDRVLLGKDIGNGNWWGRAYSLFGWRIAIRVRRKGRRQIYRQWFKFEVYNYNYSEAAKQQDVDQFQTDPECYNCGQPSGMGDA